MKKLTLLAGAAGSVLGTRDGRERSEQIPATSPVTTAPGGGPA
jgi:hypothetical protein